MAPDWKALNTRVFSGKLNLDSVRRASGGDICDSFTLAASDGQKYFVKFHPNAELLEAEYRNLQLLVSTEIATPAPIACVNLDGGAALVLEYLAFGGRGDEAQLGQQLAQLHQRCEPGGRYGLDYDNFIGHTPQCNQWFDQWDDFWWCNRLEPQLAMAVHQGYKSPITNKALKNRVTTLLGEHQPPSSILHGDLWGGNKSYLADGRPVIFDPASYYGDRETDIAFTRVFGGFSSGFYRAYESVWPLPEGWRDRESVYNLYHMLNHFNLFGSSYSSSVNSLMARLG